MTSPESLLNLTELRRYLGRIGDRWPLERAVLGGARVADARGAGPQRERGPEWIMILVSEAFDGVPWLERVYQAGEPVGRLGDGRAGRRALLHGVRARAPDRLAPARGGGDVARRRSAARSERLSASGAGRYAAPRMRRACVLLLTWFAVLGVVEEKAAAKTHPLRPSTHVGTTYSFGLRALRGDATDVVSGRVIVGTSRRRTLAQGDARKAIRRGTLRCASDASGPPVRLMVRVDDRRPSQSAPARSLRGRRGHAVMGGCA